MPTVLLIDDEPIILAAFADYLEDEGFQVVTAPTGEQGIEIYRNQKPDAVICDLVLPGIGGLDVLESLRSENLPFIILSGNQDIRKALEAQHLGAWDYLMKPLEDLGQMTLTLRKVLERRDLLRRQKEHQEDLEQRVKDRTWELRQKIQELQTTQDSLKASLEEKSALLSEVHHRVKNNLQIILSLISLQQSRVFHPEALEALEEVARRLHGMAAIHETLTDTGFVTHIPCRNFLFDLFKDTLVSRGMDTRGISLNADDVEMEISHAFPAGLAVYEIGAALADYLLPGATLKAVMILERKENQFRVQIQENSGLFDVWKPETKGDLHGTLLEVLVKQIRGQWGRTAKTLDILFNSTTTGAKAGP